MLTRRAFTVAADGSVAAACIGARSRAHDGRAKLRELELAAGGTPGAGFGWRERHRFRHCSSFKQASAGVVGEWIEGEA